MRKQHVNALVAKATRRHAVKPGPPPPSFESQMDVWGSEPSAAPRRSQRARKPELVPTAIPAVQVAQEGASYNPPPSAHRALLEEAAGHELERQRRARAHRLKLFARRRGADPDDFDALLGEYDMEALAEAGDMEDLALLHADGMGEEGGSATAVSEEEDGAKEKGEEEGEDGEDGQEDIPALGKARGKLTITQRNRLRRAKEKLAEEQAAKAERKRAKQLGRIQNLTSEIAKEERSRTLQQRREQAQKGARRKKLGRLKYTPRRPDVLLTDELPGSLRALPSETSLFEDRFDSMQARSLIEPRKRAAKAHNQKKRYKSVMRESHKGKRFKSPYIRDEQKPAWV
uniref:Ribosome biogenesis protein NOP53 n=1 Tax=Coccolithus braarudii TaxID=221442 RepID=A0A7S0PVQ0_9EUKA